MAEKQLRLRVVLDMVDKALAPLKRIGEGSGETARAIKAAKDQLKAMGDTQKAVGDFRQARTGLDDLQVKLGAARDKARTLAQAYAQTGPPTKAMHEAMAKVRAEANQAGAAFNAQQQRVQQLRDKLSAAGISTKNLSEHERKLRADIAATTAGITRQTDALKAQAGHQRRAATVKAAQQGNVAARGDARGALFDGVAMAATLGAPIKMAMDWEQRLAEFNKVASQTPQELSAIADKAQQMAVKTGVAREEIMGAYIAASQAGFDRSEWDQFADVSAKMGVAFDTTGEKAGEMLKAWRAGMNLSMDQAALLAGAVNHIANNMNAKAVDVGGVLQRQGSYLSAMGLNETQSAALAATMLSGGATEEIAATASKNFMKALTVGFAATKSQIQVFDMLNVDSEKLAKVMQKAPEKAIVEVMKRLKSLKAEEQAPAMKMLFGDESIGPASQIVKNVDGLVKAMEMVGDTSKYAQSLEDEFNAMGNTTQQQAKKATEGVKMVSTALGAGLLPTINKTLDAFAPMAMNAARWMKSNQGLVESVIWVVGGLMLFKVAAIACAYVMTFIRGTLLATQGALLAVRAGWMLHTGAMVAGTNAGRAAVVISKALAAAQWLINAPVHAARWVAATAQIWAWRAAAMAAAVGAKLMAAAQWLINAPVHAARWVAATAQIWAWRAAAMAAAVGAKLMAAAQWLINAPVHAARWVAATAQIWAWRAAAMAAAVGAKLMAAAQWVLNASVMGFPLMWIIAAIAAVIAIGFLLYSNWGIIVAGGKALWGDFTATVSNLLSGGIGEWATLLLNFSPFGILWSLFTSALSMLGIQVPEQFRSFGSFIVDGLIGGITGRLGALRDTVVGAATSAAGWFKEKLGIASPSKVFTQFGGWISEGAANGIDAGQAGVRAAALAMAGAALVPVGAAQAGDIGADSAAGPAAMAPMAAMAPLAPRAAAGGAGAAGGISHISITIQAAPGMDERALAKLVAQELERIEQRKGFQSRSSLQDLD